MTIESLSPAPPGSALVDATNAARRVAGVPDLVPDPRLMRAARAYAETMARSDQLARGLDHLNAGSRAAREGYHATQATENLCSSTWRSSDPVQIWLRCPSSCLLMLSRDFTHIGTGWAENGRRFYWCQLLAAGDSIATVQQPVRLADTIEEIEPCSKD